MVSVEARMRDRYGLHPRAALRIRQVAAPFDADVTLTAEGGSPVKVASLIAVVSAGIRSGDLVTIDVSGGREAEAAEALRALLEAGVCHP